MTFAFWGFNIEQITNDLWTRVRSPQQWLMVGAHTFVLDLRAALAARVRTHSSTKGHWRLDTAGKRWQVLAVLGIDLGFHVNSSYR